MTNFKPGNTPWNKGKRGLEAGWTQERRQRASEAMRKRCQDNPRKYWVMWQNGPQPSRWLTGPDPVIKQHRLRWSRAKAQAKFWQQPWDLSWEDFLDLLKTAPGDWGRSMTDYNIARIDTTKGWNINNVKMMTRAQAMTRSTKGKHRPRPAGLGKGRHHWRNTQKG